MKIEYRGEIVELEFTQYHMGKRVAIQSYDEDGSPFDTITTNLETPDEYIKEIAERVGQDPRGVVFIRDDGFYEGNAKYMASAGLITGPFEWIPSGYVRIPMYFLTEKALKEVQRV